MLGWDEPNPPPTVLPLPNPGEAGDAWASWPKVGDWVLAKLLKPPPEDELPNDDEFPPRPGKAGAEPKAGAAPKAGSEPNAGLAPKAEEIPKLGAVPKTDDPTAPALCWVDTPKPVAATPVPAEKPLPPLPAPENVEPRVPNVLLPPLPNRLLV